MQTTGDIVIPLVDMNKHTNAMEESFKSMLSEYVWDGSSLTIHWISHSEVDAFSPGFGAVINSFIPLINTDEHNEVNDDLAGLHRSTDPGAGGFTPYYNRRVTARYGIRGGQELFVSYGDHWFKSRANLGPIPLAKDFEVASDLVRAFRLLKIQSNISDDVLMDTWHSFVTTSPFTKSRALGSFRHHDYQQEMRELQEKDLKALRIEQSSRSLKWLQHHGTCADHLRLDQSTIHQAGRGAIATRDLPAGTVVAHVPLVHITDRSGLNMYEPRWRDDDTLYMDSSSIIGQQLLVNYCFGHQQSSLLLCPYSPMASLINHNQTQKNVLLQWSDNPHDIHEPSLLNRPLTDLNDVSSTKLAMDIVATRNIRKGDEIFLDYGDAWEAAWQSHVQRWTASMSGYRSAGYFNSLSVPVRTVFEQMHEPYPDNVSIHCSAKFVALPDWRTHYENGRYEMLLGEYYPCEVLRYEWIDGVAYYTAVLLARNPKKDYDDNYLLQQVPRMAIVFADAPYSTDMFLRNAFRHEIGIPDSIFPEVWKNLHS
jgi:SET domain